MATIAQLLRNELVGRGDRVFYSVALEQAAKEPTHVYVENIFPTSFRFLIWLRFTRKLVPITFFFVYFVIWLVIRLFAILLGCCGYGDGKFASSANLRDIILQKVISIAVSGGKIDVSTTSTSSTNRRTEYTRRWRRTVWRAFWRLYAVLTYDLREFINDYCEGWKLSPEIDREFILFTDNGARLVIPCSSSMDDKELLQHVRVFYNLSRAQGGIFEFLGTKSSLRVDVVTLVQSHAVGTRVGLPLDLGRYGPFSRLVHYFKDPSELAGRTELMERLANEGVLTEPRQQTHALNIVRTWDPYVTSTIVIVPVLFSFFLSIIWALVASIHYKADINTSTQTGFTIGSYVVTAGALLIALVAFLDSKYVANDGVSSITLGKDEASQLFPSSSTSLERASSKTSSQQPSPQPQPQPTPVSTPTPIPTPASTPAPASKPLQTDPNGGAV